MVRGHHIPKSEGILFANGGCHNCSWPKATRVNESESHIMAAAVTVYKRVYINECKALSSFWSDTILNLIHGVIVSVITDALF